MKACPGLAWLLRSQACLSCDNASKGQSQTDSCCQVCILHGESSDNSCFVTLLMAPSVHRCEWVHVLPLELMSPEPCRLLVTCTGQPLPPPLSHRGPPFHWATDVGRIDWWRNIAKMTFMTCLRDPGSTWVFGSLLMHKDKSPKTECDRTTVQNKYLLY